MADNRSDCDRGRCIKGMFDCSTLWCHYQPTHLVSTLYRKCYQLIDKDTVSSLIKWMFILSVEDRNLPYLLTHFILSSSVVRVECLSPAGREWTILGCCCGKNLSTLNRIYKACRGKCHIRFPRISLYAVIDWRDIFLTDSSVQTE